MMKKINLISYGSLSSLTKKLILKTSSDMKKAAAFNRNGFFFY